MSESDQERKGSDSGKRKHPNVVIFISDQFRWDAIGVYGLNPMDLTPVLDAVARRGVLFEKEATNQPLCAPSRACLFTGLYGTRNGVWRNGLGLAPNQPTFAESFRKAGYTTNYIGKWHLQPAANNNVNSQNHAGWGPVAPEYRGGFADLWEASNVMEFTTHPYHGEIYDRDGNPIRYSGVYRSDWLTGRAVRFLREIKHEPFLLVLSIYEPHFQDDLKRVVAPKGYAERYVNAFVPRDLRFFPGHWQSEGLSAYYGCIKRLDENVETILETLSQQGLEENTIFAFTSDHGCTFGTRNAEDKRCPQDAAILVPLVIQGPGFNRSLRIPELTSHVDLGSTLLDVAGIAIPDGLQGRSFAPLLERKIDKWRNEVFIQISESMVARALRTDQFTYCVVSPKSPGDGSKEPASDRYVEYQLYDDYADPHQLVNLAGRDESREIASRLRERLKARMVEAGEAEPVIEEARLYP